MDDKLPPFPFSIPGLTLWRTMCIKRSLDGSGTSKILSYALSVFIAYLIGDFAGCIDRSIASYMHPLHLEHYNKV